MPTVENVHTNAAAYAAQVSSQPVTSEAGLQNHPTMARDLRCACNGACHSILDPQSGNGEIQFLLTTSPAGIGRLSVSIKIAPGTTGADESKKAIDETKEGQESGEIEDSYVAIETAKTAMQKVIHRQYGHTDSGSAETTEVPESFTNLTEHGKRAVFASTVEWVLSNSSELTPKWFSALLDFAAEGGLVGYLPDTVPQETYEKLDDLVENKLVKSVINTFGMRIK